MSEMTDDQARTIMPGMTHTVEAGDTLIIRDSVGDEIGVTGRLNDRTLDVLVAVSDLAVARRQGVDGVVLSALIQRVIDAHDAMPTWTVAAVYQRSGSLTR